MNEIKEYTEKMFEGMIYDAEARNLFEDDEKKFFELNSWMRILQNYDYEPDPEQIR